ncbi:MAG TPA: RNA polymerase sigma factor RpoD/SigA, partial [Candidatus Handelsmanbacteria bacterium]|nr:RNA polymerase sigma factor RpoD/SigA [Candidatus Handelsmanbacteria bacterium]
MATLQTDTLVDQYFHEIESSVGLSAAEEVEIAKRIQDGDEVALSELVQANLRFVVSVAKGYQNLGLPLSDLINEGNLGLMVAAKRFDGTKGFKFISYAVWWIRQTVLQALAEQTRSVRIPLNQNSNLAKLARTNTQLTQSLGRTPTDQEIAKEMEEPVETIRALRRVAASELSLDAPIDRSDRDSASFGERFSG